MTISSEIHIQVISVEQALGVRHEVLLPHLGKTDECLLPGDRLPESLHLGAFRLGALVGVASFLPETLAVLSGSSHMRLRQMGVSPAHRRCGVGSLLLEAGRLALVKQKKEWLWCHARQNAFTFYQRMGLTFHGPNFDVPFIGPHRIMYLHLPLAKISAPRS